MKRELAAHLMGLARVRALELARLYTFHKGMCGAADPVVGRYVVEIDVNNKAMAALLEEQDP